MAGQLFQYQGLVEPIQFLSGETVTLDKWFQEPKVPVQPRRLVREGYFGEPVQPLEPTLFTLVLFPSWFSQSPGPNYESFFQYQVLAEPFSATIPAETVTLDKWYKQHPEPLPWPRLRLQEEKFQTEPADFPGAPLVSTWYKQHPEPLPKPILRPLGGVWFAGDPDTYVEAPPLPWWEFHHPAAPPRRMLERSIYGPERFDVPDPRYDVPTLIGSLNPYAPWHWVRDVRGNTYLCNGIDRPLVWDGRSSSARLWGIDAATTAPTVGVGAAGVLTGDYYYHYAWVNSETGVVSNPSVRSSVLTLTSDKGSISGVPGSNSDPQVTHWRLFRNTAGQTTAFYKVADIAIGTTTYTDNESDATITANDVMDEDNDPPLSWLCFVAFYKGRIHLYGGRIEKEGTVTMAASVNVVGSGTDFKPSHVGQAFMIPGDAKQYTVASVTDTTHLALTASFTGTTGSGQSYKLFRHEDRADWYWGKAGQEEYFPSANSSGVFENDDDEPTGLFIVGSQLFAAKRRHLYRLLHDTDPATDGGVFEALRHRGLVNQRSVVVVGPEAFLLDEFGAYQFDGANTATPIDFAINRLIQPSTEPSADRVNWAYREKFHGVWDSKRDRILWFVCLGSDTEPKNALVYERKRQRWTVEEYRVGITSSALQRDSSNRLRAWVGDENGCVWALGISAGTDGAPASSSGTLRGTVTSASSTTLVDSTASFYSTGDKLIGVPVYNVTTGEWRTISSNTGTVLTVSSAWSATPTAGDIYRIGAIELQLRTKWFDLGAGDSKSFKKIRVYFQPTSTDYTVGLKVYYDFSTTAFLQWSSQIAAARGDGLEIPSTATSDGIVLIHMKPDNTDGYVEVPIGIKYARWMRLEFVMTDTERKPALLGWEPIADPASGGTRGGR